MAIIYENPANNYREISSAPWAWTLLFGAFYFAVKGIWKHAILSVVLGVITLGISWLVYPFLANSIVRNHYLRRGWRPVNLQAQIDQGF